MTSASWAKCSKYPKITSMSKLERGDIIVYSGHVEVSTWAAEDDRRLLLEGQVRTTSGITSSNYWTSHFICGFRVFLISSILFGIASGFNPQRGTAPATHRAVPALSLSVKGIFKQSGLLIMVRSPHASFCLLLYCTEE